MTYPPQQPQQPQYAPPPVQPPPGVPYQPPPQAPMNTLAIIAFVGSFLISLVGIICGHIALSQIKRSGERGRGLAIAATIIGYVSAALTVFVVFAMMLFWGFFLTLFMSIAAMDDDFSTFDDDWNSTTTSLYSPQGMDTGAAVFDSMLQPEWSPGIADPTDRVLPPAPDPDQTPLEVTVYVDYMCPACGAFEDEYGADLLTMLKADEIKLSIYPVTFLDSSSTTDYSTRAANLFGCAVEHDPYIALDVHSALLAPETQPAQGTVGLSDDELIELAEDTGTWVTEEFESCVLEQHFSQFFGDNTTIATTEGLPGLAQGEDPTVLASTPTVTINGEHWDHETHPDLSTYLRDRALAPSAGATS